MDDFKEIMNEQIPIKLTRFMDTLTEAELKHLVDAGLPLIAKVYQAGAMFSIEMMKELKAEL